MPKLPDKLPFGTSLARQVARQNLTRFNNVFWVAERSRRHLKGGFSTIWFPAPAPGVHGVFNSAQEWAAATDEFRDWTRQHILISAASLLEVYIKSIATTALRANPELLDRSLTGVDGYRFVFGKDEPPARWTQGIDAAVAGFAKGLWRDRLRQLEVVFAKILDLEPELQKIQNKRNRIAHQFGADRERSVPWDEVTHVVVGARDCENAIKTVSLFIAEADTKVFGALVGAHEVLSLYHEWQRKEPNIGRYKVAGNLASKFCDHIGSLNGMGIGREFAQAIASYYDAL
jgi:hypothetical protein